ncbi:MAG: hypothetical protein H6707_18585 [Deltaproteobacteria bacterium]|nr:hypothetical protein [Deltaproteobacteria bacterium]
MKVIATLLSISLVLPLAGCKREGPNTRVKAAASTSPKSKATAKSPATSGAVARIVFVDKEKACACTRERIDKSWKALTDVVGYPPVPDVERIHMDSQPEKAAPYQKQRPIMVPPAIYFFDKQNKLVKVLQGEVKSEQVRATLK